MASKKNRKIKEKISARQNTKQESQIKFAVLFMIIVLVFVLIFYFLSIEMKKFEYKEVKFEKKKLGSMKMYLASFQLKDLFGNVIDKINIYFREDPRKLERIGITDIIKLGDSAIIAADKNFSENCEDSILAASTLSAFLTRLGISVKPAVTDINEAKKLEVYYANCNAISGSSIILLRKGTESLIKKEKNCYILEASNNCEIMNVTERFMLGLYAHSRGIEI